jgi:hypothetical protein
MTTTLAWHGSQALKDEVMARLRAHRAEDAIVQGFYQQIDPKLANGYRGCAIGCTLPAQPLDEEWRDTLDGLGVPLAPGDGWHGEVELHYGIPVDIGHLIDNTFEDLDAADCAAFAVDVIDAIPVGAYLLDLAREVDEDRDGYWYDDGPVATVRAAHLIALLTAAPVPEPAA